MKLVRRATIPAVLLVLAAVPLVAGGATVDNVTRIMIFGIAALSLDLILGYGGLVSFGHAAYLGIGSYAVGIAVSYGVTNGFTHLALAIGGSAAAALVIGFVSLRVTGTTFIMLTLAFAQMLYFFCESLNSFGGDNGLNIPEHSDFGMWLDLDNDTALFYFVFAFLAVFLLLGSRLVDSRFGLVIRAAKSNQRRMEALGFSVFRYRLAAFVMSGAVCGVAGMLLANQTEFLAPAIMHWSRSGEIMIMVILGGRGTLVGPVIGAAIYLLLQQVLSAWTSHWQAILGPILIAVVLLLHPRTRAAIVARLLRRPAPVVAHG